MEDRSEPLRKCVDLRKYEELGNTKDLVGEFLNELRNAGVEITQIKGNAYILKKGGCERGGLDTQIYSIRTPSSILGDISKPSRSNA